MKPTESGWYWMRQNYIHAVTKEVMKSEPEVVAVMDCQRRGKPIKMIVGAICGGWKCPLDQAPDYWEWSTTPITPTI